jgi:DNA-binding response OmpR family regulator
MSREDRARRPGLLRRVSGVHPRGEPRTALVVEEDEAVASTIATLAEEFGFDVDVVASVAEAHASLLACAPDLLLLDLNLSDAFGAILLDEVQARGLETAVVIVSAFPLAHLVAARHGAVLVRKPLAVEELRAALGAALPDGAARTRHASSAR